MTKWRYILGIVMVCLVTRAYPQYVWYKTSSGNEHNLMLDLYANENVVMSSAQSVDEYKSNAYINYINSEGNTIQRYKVGGGFDAVNLIPIKISTLGNVLLAKHVALPEEGCLPDFLETNFLSTDQHHVTFEFTEQSHLRYPTSILVGREDLYFVAGVENRAINPTTCYTDFTNRFICAYDGQGKVLWERSYKRNQPVNNTYFNASNLLVNANDELTLYGHYQSPHVANVGYLRVHAITGDTISYIDLHHVSDYLPPDSTYYFFAANNLAGNIVLTADHDFAFCGLVDTTYTGIGRPFVGKCDVNGNIKWFKRLEPYIYTRAKVLSLENGNVLLVFVDRLRHRFWLHIFDPDGNEVQAYYVTNTTEFYNSPYHLNDAVLTSSGNLVICGMTSRHLGGDVFVSGDPFIAKIGNVGIPYKNPWEGNMVDVASYYHQPFVLYPNPTSGLVKLKTGQDGNLYIYNLLDQQVWKGRVHHFEQELDLSFLPSGLYLYQFFPEKRGKKQTGKFIKE